MTTRGRLSEASSPRALREQRIQRLVARGYELGAAVRASTDLRSAIADLAAALQRAARVPAYGAGARQLILVGRTSDGVSASALLTRTQECARRLTESSVVLGPRLSQIARAIPEQFLAMGRVRTSLAEAAAGLDESRELCANLELARLRCANELAGLSTERPIGRAPTRPGIHRAETQPN